MEAFLFIFEAFSTFEKMLLEIFTTMCLFFRKICSLMHYIKVALWYSWLILAHLLAGQSEQFALFVHFTEYIIKGARLIITLVIGFQ